MSREEIDLICEHLGQLKEMLEYSEYEYDIYEEDELVKMELFNGTTFIFDKDGMLVEIKG